MRTLAVFALLHVCAAIPGQADDRRGPELSWYLSGARLGGFVEVADRSLPAGIAQEATRLERVTTAGTGALLQWNDWLAFDLGISAGEGSASQGTTRIDFDLRAMTAAARVYAFRSGRAALWISAGVRTVEVRPTGGTYAIEGRTVELPRRFLQNATDSSLGAGAGIDFAIAPRVDVSLSAAEGFGTGWEMRAAIVLRTRDRKPADPWAALPFAYEYPGRLHNEGLDAMLASIEEASRTPHERPRTREDLFRVMDASAQRFARRYGVTPPFDVRTAFVSEPDFRDATPAQRRYLAEIERTVDGARNGAPWERPLEDLARRALRELGLAEAQPLILGASVAGASLTYWRDRGDAWELAIANFLADPEPQHAKIRWWKVAVADAIGGVRGASLGVVGAVSGAVITSGGAVLRDVLR